MRWLHSITDSVAMGLSKFWEIVKDMKAWQAAVHGVRRVRYNLVTENSNNMNLNFMGIFYQFFSLLQKRHFPIYETGKSNEITSHYQY